MQPYHIQRAYERVTVFQRRLKRDWFCGLQPLEAQFALADADTPFDKRTALTYHPIHPGECWGHTWQTGWFHFTGTMPACLTESCVPVIRINTGSEALLFSPTGKALTGLTSFCWFENDFVREEYFPPSDTLAGSPLDYWCAVTANKLAGLTVDYDPPYSAEENGMFDACFKMAEAGWLRTEVKALSLDLECLHSLVMTFPENDYRRKEFARAFDAAETAYSDDPANATVARACLAPLLARPAYASAMRVTAVGHSHIDTAYMWPVREAVHKCARTYSTQLDLLEACPDYVFGASQPQHYQFIKERYPEIYARIKEAVAQGRWEPQGGMWVEADVNMPDGESLVRQFLHGKNYFMDEFGIEVRNLWLPDVFGYTGALPQIMKLARCESFVSIKLAFSEFNRHPYHTFCWRGIDGTEVLAHMPPEGMYSSQLKPNTLCKAQNDYAEGSECREFLSLFGLGDGGGGACREDLEAGRRLADLEGAPRVHFGAAQPQLERLIAHWEELPAWDGELYYERHRGTTTAIARGKRGNRKNEQLLAATEYLCSTLLAGSQYPIALLDKAWKLLLLHQFHDTMAGSSLDETYQEVERDYGIIRELCTQATTAATDKLPIDTGAVTLVNTLNTDWHGLLALPPKDGCAMEGAMHTSDGAQLLEVRMKSLSSLVLQVANTPAPDVQEHPIHGSFVLENELIRYRLDVNLQILSAYDKTRQLELIPQNQPANDFLLYRDYPINNEAWDIDLHYRDSKPEHAQNPTGTVHLSTIGSYQQARATLRIGSSRIDQVLRLANDSMLLEFETEVDWQEKRRMLRVAFPTTLTSDFGTYDVQFGYLRRATGTNTSWEQARFETLLHKYMDLSEAGYGVALLNDCKYGGHVNTHSLELALLRSARFPSMHSENGRQQFRYGLLPHAGTCVEARIAEIAEAFNRMPVVLPEHAGKVEAPFTIDTTDISLVACKRAEKCNDVIIRLVECYGRHTTATVTAAEGFAIADCDLLEWEESKEFIKLKPLAFHPFEVKTLRVKKL